MKVTIQPDVYSFDEETLTLVQPVYEANKDGEIKEAKTVVVKKRDGTENRFGEKRKPLIFI